MDFPQKPLLKWYKSHKRDLPWRQTNDPYFIWLSEIIMQQTQVVQGLSYYLKFIEKYPKVELLARAPADEVMKLWQGLGYYSRARNLHETAKQIVKEYKGQFPSDFETILGLKGVGTYTASAISSIAFDLPHAVVDGNVYRVLSRLFGIKTPIDSTKGKKEFQQLADSLLSKKDPGTYNQALMEFGALQCRPVNPDCSLCILNEKCFAFSKGKANEFPVKEKKTKIKDRHLNYVIYIHKEYTYIYKRDKKDIWQGLYEFQLVETAKKEKPESILKRLKLKNATIKKISPEYKHVLSHQHLYARFITVEVKKEPIFTQLEKIPTGLKGFKKVKISQINKYAFPRLIEKHLKDNRMI